MNKMEMEESLIETGVDKLVELVKAKKKISFSDAANQLGVAKQVIEEWADFLEEEGVISIDYTFTVPYLVERRLKKEELKKKEKEFHGKKEAFVRKVESILTSLEAESGGIDKMKKEFEELQKDLSGDIHLVRDELNELKKYDDLKKNIDMQMEVQKEGLRKRIDENRKQIIKEQRKYDAILQEVKSEEDTIKKEKSDTLSLEENEAALKRKLDELSSMIDRIKEKLNTEDKQITGSEKHLKALENLAEKIESEVQGKKGEMNSLIEKNRKQENRIAELQTNVMEKIARKKKKLKLEEKKVEDDIEEKFKTFFNKKKDVEVILRKVETSRNEMREELNGLIKKAVAFDLQSKSADVKSHIKKLDENVKGVEKKREEFKNKVNDLRRIMQKV